MFEILEKCPLFRGMSSQDINSIFKQVQYQVKKFDLGQMVAQSGDEISSQLVVLKGSVKGEMMDFSGKTIKIEDIGAPRPLAPAFLFGRSNVYPVNIVTNENTKILLIPKPSFIRMMQMNERFLSNFMNIISDRAQFLSNKIKFLSFHTIKGKIAFYLLEHIKHSLSDVVILDKSQAQMAELFGVTRPSLGRAIREMDQDGMIDAKAKQIRITDKIKLSALLK